MSWITYYKICSPRSRNGTHMTSYLEVDLLVQIDVIFRKINWRHSLMTYKTQDWCLHDVIDVLQKPFSTQIEFLQEKK